MDSAHMAYKSRLVNSPHKAGAFGRRIPSFSLHHSVARFNHLVNHPCKNWQTSADGLADVHPSRAKIGRR